MSFELPHIKEKLQYLYANYCEEYIKRITEGTSL